MKKLVGVMIIILYTLLPVRTFAQNPRYATCASTCAKTKRRCDSMATDIDKRCISKQKSEHKGCAGIFGGSDYYKLRTQIVSMHEDRAQCPECGKGRYMYAIFVTHKEYMELYLKVFAALYRKVASEVGSNAIVDTIYHACKYNEGYLEWEHLGVINNDHHRPSLVVCWYDENYRTRPDTACDRYAKKLCAKAVEKVEEVNKKAAACKLAEKKIERDCTKDYGKRHKAYKRDCRRAMERCVSACKDKWL